MQFFKSAIVLGLVALVAATPVPEGASELSVRDFEINEIANDIMSMKRDELIGFITERELVARVAIKDKECPDNKKTYTAASIKSAIQTENAKASPGKYNNQEGGKKLFATDKQLYKASLDNVARAVFSRGSNNAYEYRGLIEHDKGTGNGFHKC